MLHELIKDIHVDIRKKLRREVADGHTFALEETHLSLRKAANNSFKETHDVGIGNPPPQNLEQDMVINGIEEFSHVAFQHEAGRRVVSARFSHHTRQRLDAFVRTLADTAGVGIGDEGRLKDWIQYLKDGMMDDPITDGGLMDVSLLGIGNEERGV